MGTLLLALLFAFVLSAIASFLLRGKQVKENVKELLGVGKRKVVKLLYEFRRKTFHLFGMVICYFLIFNKVY